MLVHSHSVDCFITFRLLSAIMDSAEDDGDIDNDAASVHSGASDSQAGHYTDPDRDDGQHEQDYDEPVSAQADLAGQGQGGAVSLRQPCRDHSSNLPRAAWTYVYML